MTATQRERCPVRRAGYWLWYVAPSPSPLSLIHWVFCILSFLLVYHYILLLFSHLVHNVSSFSTKYLFSSTFPLFIFKITPPPPPHHTHTHTHTHTPGAPRHVLRDECSVRDQRPPGPPDPGQPPPLQRERGAGEGQEGLPQSQCPVSEETLLLLNAGYDGHIASFQSFFIHFSLLFLNVA